MEDTKSYWISHGLKFSSYYSKNSYGLKKYLSRFLELRSLSVVKLIKNENLDKVLDVGCGSGEHMKLLSYRSKIITGVDISLQMIFQAKKNLKQLNINNFELVLGGAESLPFKDNSFTSIICVGVTDYVPNPSRVLSECYRLLKKEGHLVFTIPKKPSIFFFLRGKFGGLLKRKIFGMVPVTNTLSKKELCLLLDNSGLKVISIGSLWTSIWIVKCVKK